MAAERFNVVLEGTTVRGEPLSAVADALARLIRRDVDFAAKLLLGQPTKIKSGVDAATGGRYIEALGRVGAAAHLEPETLEIDPEVTARVEGDGGATSSRVTRSVASTATSAPAAPTAGAAVVDSATPEPNAASRAELYRAFLGEKNQAYYLTFFAEEDSTRQREASWNWPAFFLTSSWALYRKMYLWFFVWWAFVVVDSMLWRNSSSWGPFLSNVVAMAIFGALANHLYHRTVTKRILAAKTIVSDRTQLIAYLKERGGVHKWVVWLAVTIWVVGILAAIILPTWLDR